MRIDIITLFPTAITPYLTTSILGRAQRARRVRMVVHDLRRWGLGERRTVDDTPYGGGPGMVLRVEPFHRALRARELGMRNSERGTRRTRVILTSAKGRRFTQRDAERYAKRYDRLVILCGHYEGVDERVAKELADEEVSIGSYVLTGGELPALVITDAVIRLIPGVLGDTASLAEESFAVTPARRTLGRKKNLIRDSNFPVEYPHYTRPAMFHPDPRNPRITWRVPMVLRSGNHAAIAAWRVRHRRTSSR